MKKLLCLADLENYTEEEVKEHLVSSYEASDLEGLQVLVAYESVGKYGCDSSSFFLLQEEKTGKLFEVHAEHCSLFGFEGQFDPEETTLEYLRSDHFTFSSGGYDQEGHVHKEKVKNFIYALKAA